MRPLYWYILRLYLHLHFTFTFSHFADAFIQSDLQLGIHKVHKVYIFLNLRNFLESNILFFTFWYLKFMGLIKCFVIMSVLWIWMTWQGEVCTWVTFLFMMPPETLCCWGSSFVRSTSWPKSWRSWLTVCSTRSEPWRMRRRRQTGQSSKLPHCGNI